jgi:hypothetical protein
MRPLIKINLGDKFGRLEVSNILEPIYNLKGKMIRKIECKCVCGNYKIAVLNELRRGNIKSCGCLKNEISKIINIKHNDVPQKSKHRYLYNTWIGIKARCYNPNHIRYKYYGGEGKGLFNDWIKDYPLFKKWILNNIGERPIGFTLDRINNDLGYEPGNLRWASTLTQNKNRRNFDTKRS